MGGGHFDAVPHRSPFRAQQVMESPAETCKAPEEKQSMYNFGWKMRGFPRISSTFGGPNNP